MLTPSVAVMGAVKVTETVPAAAARVYGKGEMNSKSGHKRQASNRRHTRDEKEKVRIGKPSKSTILIYKISITRFYVVVNKVPLVKRCFLVYDLKECRVRSDKLW